MVMKILETYLAIQMLKTRNDKCFGMKQSAMDIEQGIDFNNVE